MYLLEEGVLFEPVLDSDSPEADAAASRRRRSSSRSVRKRGRTGRFRHHKRGHLNVDVTLENDGDGQLCLLSSAGCT